MSVFKCVAAAVLAVAVGGVVVAADAIKADLKDFKWKCKFEGGEALGGFDENENRFFFYTYGTATGNVNIPEDGDYTITVDASCTEALKELAKFKLSVGDVVVAKEHACTTDDAKKYALTAKLKKGKQPVVIEFLNDKFKEGEYDLNLFVFDVSLELKPSPPVTKKDGEMKAGPGDAPPPVVMSATTCCVAVQPTCSRRVGLFARLFGRRCR